jgi:methylated-DNA-[protein]-cysteine S-methyltransferase
VAFPAPAFVRKVETMVDQTFDSPFGSMFVTSSDDALVAVGWGRAVAEHPDPLTAEAVRQLQAYFAGRLTEFDLPLRPRGSDFRLKVWRAMQTIPHGQTRSYAAIAETVGSAPRAVGGACGANPLPIVIPCHRVVGSHGLSGGYSGEGGLATKAWLLDHERATV